MIDQHIASKDIPWSSSTGEREVGIERSKRSRHPTGARLVSMKLSRVPRGYEMPFWSWGGGVQERVLTEDRTDGEMSFSRLVWGSENSGR